MAIMPATILTLFSFFVNLVTIVVSLVTGSEPLGVLKSSLESIFNSSLMMFGVGFVATVAEWKEIRCPWWQKILYMFTFPLFMFTYVPIAITAMFSKVEWKQIKHSDSKSIEQMEKKNFKKKEKKSKDIG